MKKSTVALSILTLLLLVSIGLGIWVLIQHQNNLSQDKLQTPAAKQQQETFAIEEVATHNSRTDCWTIISGQVYVLTDFINRHPGGDEILRACGTDSTTLFDSRQTQDGQAVGSGTPHSQFAKDQLVDLKIGTIDKK